MSCVLLRDKLTSPQCCHKNPGVDSILSGCDPNRSDPAQLGQLACIGTQLQPGNIVFASFPEQDFTATRIYDPVFKGRVFIWDVDFNILRDYVTQFNQGTWPIVGATPETYQTRKRKEFPSAHE